MTIKFAITNRRSGKIQFTAEIDCAGTAARAVKVGLAVRWGLKNKVDLRGADLRRANLRRADLRRADLRRADLRGANLLGADLQGADLSDANLWDADLLDADLRVADLRRANLLDADLRGCDLQGANLSEAELRGANLLGADLRAANLSSTNLREANLQGAKLQECDLREANYLFIFGPIGKQRRMGSLSIDTGGEPIVHLGCFAGSEAEALAKIMRDYGEPNTYSAVVAAMCAEARRMASECKAPESEAA